MRRATVSQEDLDIIHVVDEPEEAMGIIRRHYSLRQKAKAWD